MSELEFAFYMGVLFRMAVCISSEVFLSMFVLCFLTGSVNRDEHFPLCFSCSVVVHWASLFRLVAPVHLSV